MRESPLEIAFVVTFGKLFDSLFMKSLGVWEITSGVSYENLTGSLFRKSLWPICRESLREFILEISLGVFTVNLFEVSFGKLWEPVENLFRNAFWKRPWKSLCES